MSCHECGGAFEIDEAGIANHISESPPGFDETPDGIDYDADLDHVPYSLEPDDQFLTLIDPVTWQNANINDTKENT